MTAGAVLLAAFVWWELRADKPMLPMQLFAVRAFSAGNVAGFFLYTSLFSAVFFIPQYLQRALGYDPFASGLRMLPWVGVVFVVAPLSGSLVSRLGERPVLVGGL